MLHYDFLEVDRKFIFYHTQAVAFIMQMIEIPLPTNQLPVFGLSYTKRLTELSNKETFVFYADAIIKRVNIQPNELKNTILDFFTITDVSL